MAGERLFDADGTSLTVEIDTFGLTPGLYDMVLDGPGYSVGTLPCALVRLWWRGLHGRI